MERMNCIGLQCGRMGKCGFTRQISLVIFDAILVRNVSIDSELCFSGAWVLAAFKNPEQWIGTY